MYVQGHFHDFEEQFFPRSVMTAAVSYFSKSFIIYIAE